jgi:hypothetical protein
LPADARLRLTLRTDRDSYDHVLPLVVRGSVDAAVTEPASPAPASPDPPADLEPIQMVLEEACFDGGGRLRVRGWAVATRTVRSIDVFLGEQRLGQAELGQSRSDVAAAHPAYPNAATAGFTTSFSLPSQKVKARLVKAIVTDGAGGTLSTAKAATGDPADPSDRGPATTPERAPLLVTLEQACLDRHGVLRVRGWAVGLSAINRVEVFVKNKPIGVASHNMPRDDVWLAYPAYPNSQLAGFLLVTQLPDRRLLGQGLRVVVFAGPGEQAATEGVITAD